MSKATGEIKRVTTHVIQAMKDRGEKIAMLTAYDFSMARILDEAGIDILLVGDSASNVMAGHRADPAHHPRPDDIPCAIGGTRREPRNGSG